MRASATVLAALLTASCTSQDRECSFLERGYARPTEDLARLPSVQVPKSARRTVERCYSKHPYLDYHGPFEFVGAKRSTTGYVYLVYRPVGITDVQLVFELGEGSQPLNAFQRSTL